MELLPKKSHSPSTKYKINLTSSVVLSVLSHSLCTHLLFFTRLVAIMNDVSDYLHHFPTPSPPKSTPTSSLLTWQWKYNQAELGQAKSTLVEKRHKIYFFVSCLFQSSRQKLFLQKLTYKSQGNFYLNQLAWTTWTKVTLSHGMCAFAWIGSISWMAHMYFKHGVYILIDNYHCHVIL